MLGRVQDTIPIGEFARRSGLSVSALRFYDDRGLFRPVEVDRDSGYRFYAESQLEEAALIRDLRRLEVPLASVAAFLSESPMARHKLLATHMETLRTRFEQASATASRVARTINGSEDPMTTTLQARDLAAAIDHILPAVGEDRERPVLTCVLVEAKEGSLRLVATDSFRLAVRDIPLPGAGADLRLLLAGETLRRLRPLLDGDGAASIDVDGKRVTVTGPSGSDSGWTVAAEFPAYEQLMAADSPSHVLGADRSAVAAALHPLVALQVVELRFGTGSLRIGPPGEAHVVDVPAEYDGDGFVVAVNPRFALYAVESAVGADLVIEASHPRNPITFRSADDGTAICLVMPVEVS